MATMAPFSVIEKINGLTGISDPKTYINQVSSTFGDPKYNFVKSIKFKMVVMT